MKKTVYFLSLLIALASGCTFKTESRNDTIPPEVKATIRALNGQILDGFANNDKNKILKLCSQPLLDKGEDQIAKLLENAHGAFPGKGFIVLNEYYEHSSAEGATIEVKGQESAENEYAIAYKALTKESYVVLGYCDNGLDWNSLLLVYGKYPGGWKLNICQIGTIRMMQKDAFGWRREAEAYYRKGDLVDAANAAFIAKTVLKPGNEFFHYKKESETEAYIDKITRETNAGFKWPITIDYVPTHPKIFRVYPQGIDEGYFPMVVYTTSIGLDDTVRLARECDEIHKGIGQLFKGLDQNNKMIFYRALNHIPRENERVKHYGFVRKTRQ